MKNGNLELNAEKLYKNSEKMELPKSKCGKVKIIKAAHNGKFYALYAFPKKRFIKEEIKHKIHFIHLDQYFLTLKVDSPQEERNFNLTNLTVYNTATGATTKSTLEVSGYQIIVLNQKIMAVWEKEGVLPRFFVVISDKLTEISSTAVENILSFSSLSPTHQQALVERYPQRGWESHNGILINPQTLDIPSKLMFAFWKKENHRSKVELARVDTMWLANVLTGKDGEKTTIWHINF